MSCATMSIRGWSLGSNADRYYKNYNDSYDYPPSAYRLEGDDDDGDYDYAPAA